ncbi:MAG: hypothetical protein ACOC0P_03595, partial [Planctomycetota bacterium]
MLPMSFRRNLRVRQRTSRIIAITAALGVAAMWSPAAPAQETEQNTYKFVSPSASPDDEFGYAIAANGGRLLVGARNQSTNGENAGAAYEYVFNSVARVWNPGQQLLPASGEAWDAFGTAVDISQGLSIVGAPGAAREPDLFSGAAFVYRFNSGSGTWNEEQRLVPEDGESDARFGDAVAINQAGGVAIVGAPFDTERGFEAGAAYIYRFRNPTEGWVQEQKLLGHNTDAFDRFGISVDIIDDVAIVGAPLASNFSGTAYIFRY